MRGVPCETPRISSRGVRAGRCVQPVVGRVFDGAPAMAVRFRAHAAVELPGDLRVSGHGDRSLRDSLLAGGTRSGARPIDRGSRTGGERGRPARGGGNFFYRVLAQWPGLCVWVKMIFFVGFFW